MVSSSLAPVRLRSRHDNLSWREPHLRDAEWAQGWVARELIESTIMLAHRIRFMEWGLSIAAASLSPPVFTPRPGIAMIAIACIPLCGETPSRA